MYFEHNFCVFTNYVTSQMICFPHSSVWNNNITLYFCFYNNMANNSKKSCSIDCTRGEKVKFFLLIGSIKNRQHSLREVTILPLPLTIYHMYVSNVILIKKEFLHQIFHVFNISKSLDFYFKGSSNRPWQICLLVYSIEESGHIYFNNLCSKY